MRLAETAPVEYSVGSVHLFDDSFEHEVWHDGDRDRIVLLIQFHTLACWHQRRTGIGDIRAWSYDGKGDEITQASTVCVKFSPQHALGTLPYCREAGRVRYDPVSLRPVRLPERIFPKVVEFLIFEFPQR